MVAWLRISVAVVLTALLGACAQLPSAENVSAFANATNNVAEVLKTTIEVNTELAQRSTDEAEASKYIGQLQRCAFLAPASADPKPTDADQLKCPAEPSIKTGDLPPKLDNALSKNVVEPRRKLVEALGRYAKGLAAAANQGDVQALETAAASLASTVSVAITPLVGPTAPLIGPVFKLAGRGLGLALGNAYAIEIGRIVADTDPFVQQAVIELKDSVQLMNYHNKTLLSAWQAKKRNNLVYVASHTLTNRSDAYKDYLSAIAEGRELKSKVEALKNLATALDKLGKAHTALAKASEQGNADLADFIALSGDLSAILPLLKPSK